jgi:hypothetical protein
LVFSLFFISSEICFSMYRWPLLAAGARWFLWSEDIGLEVVDLSFFSDFVDGRQRILVQDNTYGDIPSRHATATCALLRAAGMFIDSQSLVGDGVFLDLALVEAQRQRPFRHAS